MASDVGQGLIPEVDNIHTFDTIVEVETYNHLFTAATDSFNTTPADIQFLGLISDDPIFGETDARLFFQLYPGTGKRVFVGPVAGRVIDSAVLSIPYSGTYGDTLAPQNLEVSEIAQSTDFKSIPYSINPLNNTMSYKRDSAYSIRYNNFQLSGVIGGKTVIPAALRDSTLIIRGDTSKVVNMIRIRLDDDFGQRLLNYDTIGLNDAYSSDSAFRKRFKGFAIKSSSGNGIMGLSARGATMTIYYRYSDIQLQSKDTTATFVFHNDSSAYANYVGRDYSGTQIATTASDNVEDQIVYIQNTPGTYATLKIPALANMGNRIVHLAQLQIESVHDQSDTIFRAPSVMFMDVYDAAANKYAFVPYSFNFSQSGEPGLDNFGSYAIYNKDEAGNSIRQWRFNLTRYVQNIVNNRIKNNELRLYAAPLVSLNFWSPATNSYQENVQGNVNLGMNAVFGRVRLGGGTHPTQKMKMRIVYSKI